MILYHGTSSKHLEAIQKSGLQSRRITRRRSNWKGDIRSKLDLVYLTDAYPVYYAMNPAVHRGGNAGDVLVLKVEVEESQLYPDEDFIAWELARHNEGLSIRKLIAEIDPADYREHWRASLERNGVVCTPGVAAERIVDYKILSHNNYKLLYAIGGDSMPTPINYMVCGSMYRQCVAALFEQGEDAALKAAASFWSLTTGVVIGSGTHA